MNWTIITFDFELQLFQNEVDETLSSLLESNSLIIIKEKYKLSEEKYDEIYRTDLENKRNEEQRFVRFEKLVKDIETVDTDELSLLW